MMKETDTRTYDGKQIQLQDARQIFDIRQTVPAERRDKFMSIANVYMDGIVAGIMFASGKTQ